MAHKEQKDFCLKVKNIFPNSFKQKVCLDVGSLDINGSNRFLFNNCSYTGIDIGPGRNVDVVAIAHEFNAPDNFYDTIISTECFEHDMHYEKTIKNIIRMLKPNGLFLFTCATTGRKEHGTARTSPEDAPLTHNFSSWTNYYKNLTEHDFISIDNFSSSFSKLHFEVNDISKDLYFYGIKK